MKSFSTKLLQDEDGQGMIEYELIIAGIALACFAAIWAFGPALGNYFNGVATKLGG